MIYFTSVSTERPFGDAFIFPDDVLGDGRSFGDSRVPFPLVEGQVEGCTYHL